MYPFVFVALALAFYYALAAWRQPRLAAIVAALLWLLYAVFELLIARAILCGENCNIRVDLLLIWPILWVASFFASKPEGMWSPRTKVFGVLSIGSLVMAVGMVLLLYLESKDLFFPARKACKAGQENALRACDEALAQAPGDFTLYYHRALAYRATGERDRAMADMSKAIASYADYTAARVGRGVLAYDTGDIEAALSDFDAAVKINGTDAVAQFWRGLAFAKKGGLEEAEACFTKALEFEAKDGFDPENRLAPAKGQILDGRGLVKLRAGKWEQATSDYDAALKLDPRLPSALYGRGLAKMKTGDAAGGAADIAAAQAISAGVGAEFAKLGLD